ncbi:MAG: hypothetical protein U0165_13695 [Polyangiaceae bacterium]
MSGSSLHDWAERWKGWLDGMPPTPEAMLNGPSLDMKRSRELSRSSRLAELLASSDHAAAALPYAAKAAEISPREPTSRARHSKILHALGQSEEARKVLGELEQIQSTHGVWFALDGERQRAAGNGRDILAFDRAIWFDPLAPEVACEMLNSPLVPAVDARAKLCVALRHVQRD